jgi:predicted nucleic acid-binding protein
VIVVNTGPIVAAMNDRDQRHAECADLFRKGKGPFFVPGPVLAEVCYLLESRRGPQAEAAFLDSLGRRELELVGLVPRDLARMADSTGDTSPWSDHGIRTLWNCCHSAEGDV